MNSSSRQTLPLLALLLALAPLAAGAATPASSAPIKPRLVTEPTRHDTDDPAIWINRANPAGSLIIGTDKDADGALYVYGLDGKIHPDKVVRGIVRPNNVDVAYDLMVGGVPTDVAVTTERYGHRLRVYRLPDMAPIDGGGIPVFEGELARDCMGIALYTRPSDGALFAIVSRSDFQAPSQGYLHQYRLVDDGTGTVRGVFTRAFGEWSGKKEIEAIAVDQELGYVYYSDENFGIRKWHADPLADDSDEEIAVFGRDGFAEDREGISIYPTGPGTGYILVSDQQNNMFRIFRREGTAANPHEHAFIKSVTVSTDGSDGSEVTSVALPGFPNGLFVAMSENGVFHYYSWDDLAGGDLKRTPQPVPPATR